MRRLKRTLTIGLLTALTIGVGASFESRVDAQQQKSLGAAIGVYVFPNAGQAASQQSKDEGECYQWAVQNTGSDPFQLQQQAQAANAQAQAAATQGAPPTAGSGVRGAARGAAGGALIGGIAGDAGKGAAIGAAAGAVGGRMRSRSANQQAAQQNASANQQATAQQMDNFKKAFSVCLEAKKYMVKY
jgi:hypothetical protein